MNEMNGKDHLGDRTHQKPWFWVFEVTETENLSSAIGLLLLLFLISKVLRLKSELLALLAFCLSKPEKSGDGLAVFGTECRVKDPSGGAEGWGKAEGKEASNQTPKNRTFVKN